MDNKTIAVYAYQPDSTIIEQYILESNSQKIYFLHFDEYDIIIGKKEVEYINKNNIEIIVSTCTLDQKWLENRIIELGVREDLFKCQIWPTFYFVKTDMQMKAVRNIFYENSSHTNIKFTHPFLCFIGRGKKHRCMLLDELQKESFLDKGLVTFHDENNYSKVYKWKYYNGGKLHIDDEYLQNRTSYSFNEKFFQGFLHLVAETDEIVPIISEKTATPLLCKRPFLILGAVNIHKKLQELGFLLYDEIFDYSFDDEEDIEKRIELYLKNVHAIIFSEDLEGLYEKIKEKIEFNYNLAKNFARSSKSVPSHIKEYFKTFPHKEFPLPGDEGLAGIFNNFEDNEEKFYFQKTYRPEKLYFHYAEINYEEIVEEIKNKKPKRIIILGEIEWQPWATKDFVNIVNQYDIKVTFVLGCKESGLIKNYIEDLNINNVNVEYWPKFYFRYSTPILKTLPPIENKHISIPFICLNNNPHIHRCFLIDKIAKYNLFDKGVVSWADINGFVKNMQFDFEYFDKKTIIDLDNMASHRGSYVIPKEYNDVFFDFVTESTSNVIFITEKTIKPLIFKKPFAVLGYVGINQYLRELGFELYDEIIDYSFDNIEDLNIKTEMFAQEMIKISNLTNLNDVYKSLEEKINYNYNRCLELSKDMELPKEIHLASSLFLTNPFIDQLGCLARYKNYNFDDCIF